MGLYHRIPRQLRANIWRYFSLFFLIVLCMYIVISITGAADTIIKAVDDGAVLNNREDGQFTVFSSLTQDQLDELSAAGAAIEPMFYLDFEMEDGSMLRVFRNREHINLVQPEDGALPQRHDEILVEQLYAGAHGIRVNDNIIIGGISFSVSGVGSSPDYDSPFQNLTDVATDKWRFGTAFVSEQTCTLLQGTGKSIQSETYLYAYCLNDNTTHEVLKDTLKGFHIDRDAVTDTYLLELIEEAEERKNDLLDGVAALVDGGVSLSEALELLKLNGEDLSGTLSGLNLPPQLAHAIEQYLAGVGSASDGLDELLEGLYELQTETDEMVADMFGFDIENLTSFLKAENNPRIAASADDVIINKFGGILAGVIALILFSYVISVFTVHSIDSDSEVIGTLSALGVSHGALLRHYLVLPTLISALGGICGTLLGFSSIGAAYQMQDTASYFSYPAVNAYYPPYLLIYGLAMPALIALLVNMLVIRRRLSKPPLALLRKERADAGVTDIQIRGIGFIGLFRLRQMLREKRASLTVCGGMFIALMLLILGVNCFSFIARMQEQNDADIQYEYMVSLKYPPKAVPEDSSAVYLYTLTKESYGSELDISILGIEANNPYFDFSPQKGEEQLTVSSSMANKFHLKAGDTVILTDSIEDRRYVFTIDRIVPYSVGLYAFMDIGSARSLYGAKGDAYNILLADHMPDIEPGRVYGITTKAGILEYSNIFMELMTPMMGTMIGVATVVFVIVMYLMMKMMIDRSAFGISLFKIFGYRDKEVRRLYLDGNFITVATGAVIAVPLAKLVMDALYPMMISNVAFGPDMTLMPWLYVVIFALIFVSYFFTSLVLNRRLKRVAPTEVLKQRE